MSSTQCVEGAESAFEGDAVNMDWVHEPKADVKVVDVSSAGEVRVGNAGNQDRLHEDDDIPLELRRSSLATRAGVVEDYGRSKSSCGRDSKALQDLDRSTAAAEEVTDSTKNLDACRVDADSP